jgi:hypothetical protein
LIAAASFAMPAKAHAADGDGVMCTADCGGWTCSGSGLCWCWCVDDFTPSCNCI